MDTVQTTSIPAIHQDSTTPKTYKNPSNYKFNCDCGKNFSGKKHYNAHRKKVHNDPSIIVTKPAQSELEKNNKQCPLCEFCATFRSEMIKHFEIFHNISFVEETYTFASQNEFFLWKSKIESDTKSKYVKKGTEKFSKHTITHFNCHRSGCYVTRGKGLRSLKTQGSVKINSFCPSRIKQKCLKEDGTCIISFSPRHVGHQNELKYLTLTPTERQELAKKIALKIPFEEILDEIRDLIYDCSVQRIHLLTRKDLYNIEMAYNLQSKAVRHRDDAISVDAWVREMQNEGRCVLFYKPQGIYTEHHPYLKSEDFILIISTEAQLDILRKYGNDVICLDGTHGLNSYDFELNTILVLDELREGFPCRFLISNRSDTQVLGLFSQTLREELNERLKPKVFMSDLADTFYNAWISVMGIPEKRLYCTWHVDRSWRKNLNKIKSRDTQVSIYKHLRTILTERDKTAFEKMLQEFCNINNDECLPFIKYFKEHYACKYEYWAYSSRLHAGINTNMHLERMHRSLKYIYLKGKNVKRLDKGIHAIMRYVRDKLINRVIVNNKGKICSKLANIRSRHHAMEKIDPSRVLRSDDGWEVLSETCQEMYLVQKQEANCNNCQLVCLDCCICIHQFQCSCIDSAIKYNICKHIHLVAKLNKVDPSSEISDKANIEETTDLLVIAESENDNNCESAICDLSKGLPFCQDVDMRKKKLQDTFLETVGSISSIKEVEAMENLLSQAGPLLAAIREKTVAPFPKKADFVANKNIVPQRVLFSTKKKRAKKTTIPSHTSAEINKNAIGLMLKNNN